MKSQTKSLNQQRMSLDEYKKKALDYLTRTYGDTTKAITREAMEKTFLNLGMKTDADWEMYMDDFSPEETMQGRIAGLI